MPVEYEPTSENIVCHYADGVRLVLDFLKKPFGDRLRITSQGWELARFGLSARRVGGNRR